MFENFEKANREYEYHRNYPFDKGGALYDYDEELKKIADYEDEKGNNDFDEWRESHYLMLEHQAEAHMWGY